MAISTNRSYRNEFSNIFKQLWRYDAFLDNKVEFEIRALSKISLPGPFGWRDPGNK